MISNRVQSILAFTLSRCLYFGLGLYRLHPQGLRRCRLSRGRAAVGMPFRRRAVARRPQAACRGAAMPPPRPPGSSRRPRCLARAAA